MALAPIKLVITTHRFSGLATRAALFAAFAAQGACGSSMAQTHDAANSDGSADGEANEAPCVPECGFGQICQAGVCMNANPPVDGSTDSSIPPTDSAPPTDSSSPDSGMAPTDATMPTDGSGMSDATSPLPDGTSGMDATASDGSGGGDAMGPDASFGPADLAHCVEVLNTLRGSMHMVMESSALETFATAGAQADEMSGMANHYFTMTNGGGGVASGQAEITNWTLSQYGSVRAVIDQGIMMIGNGAPSDPATMQVRNPAWTTAGCGVSVISGNVWVVLAFH
jgi:hypothetical protein